jgi:TP901 family phage tail tape measure protein
MSEGIEGVGGPIDVPVTSSGAEGIERIVTALDRLHDALQGLGAVSGLTRLEQQMQLMQASMTTGFAAVAALAQKVENEAVAAAERASAKTLNVHQRRDVELNRLRGQAMADYVSWWDKMLSIEESRDTELNRMRQKSAAEYAAWWEKTAAERAAIEQRRDVELNAMQQKAAADYVSWWAKAAAEREAIEQRRDIELHAMRQRDLADYVSWWDRTLAVQEAATARQLAVAEAAAERQRVLNTNFMTAGPAAQIRSATQAQTYLQQPGATREGAIERYGSVAVASDVEALRAAHAALTPAVANSTSATEAHNRAMNEAHSLARGLAGSLGGLWLTYGSLVPLAAGAAIAGSLRQVVDVGAQVEHQLTNVLAITGSGVNLDQFLQVSDGSLHSLVEGANAMRMLAQNGLNASESLQVLPAILDLATAGEMSVGQAALAATGAASAFGLGYSEAGRVADIFAKTAANSNTSVLEMTESMKQASTVASLFKVSIEETAGMLGLLAKINVTGGAAGTSLTNMLTGLYEPTEKGKKALKELGVETSLASGQLKPFTQLLEELKGKLAGFTDAARVDFLGSIFTVRGTKAAELALSNLDAYKEKVQDAATASGFMADVVRKLEDDTTGGFQRLGVVVQNSFVRAFAQASPYVQHIALELTDAFKDGGSASTGLQNFSTNVARLTGALVDNLGTVTLVGAGYVGLRALGPTIGLLKEAAAASWVLSAAQAAETAAMGALTAANVAGAATAAEVTAVTTAQTAATEAATVASAAWSATLLPVLGAVAVAVGLGAAAWLLFRDNTDEADKTNQKIANSLQVVDEALERENKRLDENLKLWDAKNGVRLAPETVTQSAVDAARAQVQKLEQEARRRGFDPDEIRHPQESGYDAGSGVVTLTRSYDGLAEAIAKADKNLAGLESRKLFSDDVVGPKQALEKAQNATTQLRDELAKFYAQASERDSKGELYQQNAAVRAVSLKAAPLWESLLDAKQILPDPKDELARVNALSVSLRKLQDERNALLAPRAPKEDKKAERDALQAQIAQNALAKELFDVKQKTALLDLQSQHQSGGLGDVAYMEAKAEAAKQSVRYAIAQAQADIAVVHGAENKRAAEQKYQNQKQVGQARLGEIDRQLAIEEADYFERLHRQNLTTQAEEYKRSGDLVNAYLTKFEADNGTAIARMHADLKGIDRDALAAILFVDPDNTEALKAYNHALELTIALRAKASEKDAGVKNAEFDMVKNQLDSLVRTINAQMASAKETGQEQGGLLGALGVADAAQGIRTQLLPQVQQLASQLQDIAGRSGLPELAEKAKAAGIEISKLGKDLSKTSSPYGDEWKSVWKDIMDGGRQAFLHLGDEGISFVDRVAHALRAGILDLLWQMTAKKWLLQIGGSIEAGAAAGMAGASSLVGGLGGGVAGSVLGTIGSIGSTIGGIGSLLGASSLSGFGSGLMAGLQYGTMAEGMVATGAATGTLGAGMAAGASVGSTVSAAIAAIPGWGWAAMGAAVLGSFLFDKGPEDHTSLTFGSNNLPGNVDINHHGNEGNNIPYLSSASTSAFGTFGATGGFWMDTKSKQITDFVATVGKVDDVLAAFLTAGERSQVKDYLSSQSLTVDTGHEGSDPNANGQLDAVFTARIRNILDGVQGGLSSLVDGFKGTSQELATEAGAILQYRAALRDAGEAVFGEKVTLEQLAALKLPTEATSAALKRVTDVFSATDVVAQQMGKSMQAVFGAVGLASMNAREALVQAVGSVDALNTETAFFAQNFLSEAQKIAPVKQQLDAAMGSLGLAGVTTKTAFRDTVLGLNLTTDEGRKTYAALMALAPQFLQVAEYTDNLTGNLEDLNGVAKTAAEIASERKDLQGQLNQLTKTDVELAAIQRAQLDESNRALFDQVQAAKKVKDARDDLNNAYEAEKKTLEDLRDRMGKLSSDWQKLLIDLKLGDKSPLTPLEKYNAAKDEFNKTLTAAKNGDVDAQNNYSDVANKFLQASRDAFSSSSTYSADFARVMSATADAASWAAQQVDVAKDSLKALHDQVSGLIEVKKEVMSVHDAVVALAGALAQGGDVGLGGSAAAGQTAGIEALYQGLLGRHSDAGGLAFWQQAMAGGATMAEVADAMTHSPEYRDHHPDMLYSGSMSSSHANEAQSVTVTNGPTGAQIDALIAQLANLNSGQANQTDQLTSATLSAAATIADSVAAGIEQGAATASWQNRNTEVIQ